MKNSKMITIIAAIALVAVVVITLVSGTFARYATKVEDTATVKTAAWAFSAGFGTDSETNINLYDTIATPKTTYPNLTEKTIAPGTSGSFDVVIDTTGCEVGVDYKVKFEPANSAKLPLGLIFTIGDGSDEITGTESFEKTGTIALADVGKKITIPVTWEWQYGEDGDDNADADTIETDHVGKNNSEAGQTYTLKVTISGEQHIEA